jgi:hypothetical protein
LRVVRPDLPPDLAGEGGECRQLVLGGVEVFGGLGELGLQGVEDVPHLSLDRLGVGLLEDGPQQRRDAGLGGPGNLTEQVAGVMGAASLPRGAGQHRADGVHQAGVSIEDDELDVAQAAGDQRAQEGRSAGGGRRDAENSGWAGCPRRSCQALAWRRHVARRGAA